MKIVFTGGGSRGHFYPLIAVAEEVNKIVEERKLIRPELFYVGPESYDPEALYESGLTFLQSPAGKLRRYFSLKNILDIWKTIVGFFRSLWQMYRIYPDVVFSKGGYASFPTVLAAWILGIPIMIHESDVVPGRANRWSASLAKKIAISYPETAAFFPEDKTALTGQPVRQGLSGKDTDREGEFVALQPNVPTILILGGSQGAQNINNIILDALPKLVEEYQIIHQTGDTHLEEMQKTATFILEESVHKDRYHAFGFLDTPQLYLAAQVASVVISRAGSGAIFEIAQWGIPSIIIPIQEKVSHDQRKNAFVYARSGAASVIEETNLTPSVLQSEIHRLVTDKELRKKMQEAARTFSTPEAARTIAEAIVNIGVSHEQK